MLSVVSLLNEPNTSSPANVDASVMFRRWKDSKGKDKEYENIIRFVYFVKQVRFCLNMRQNDKFDQTNCIIYDNLKYLSHIVFRP